MALETVVFPHDLLNYGYRDLFSLAAGWELDFEEKNLETGSNSLFRNDQQQLQPNSGVGSHFDSIATKEYDTNSSSAGEGFFQACFPTYPAAAAVAPARRKRRRTRSCKNKEEVENQRMTHIAVERNRRKQMNEYLSVLRSLMPPSYIQRGDQASIIGGAINFVKELEQLLQSLEAQKRIKQQSNAGSSTPFADFFTFPQYSTTSTHSNSAANETTAENSSAIANIEVTMVESHANLKVLSRRRPRQLLKMVAQFHDLHLTILHLNITTVDQMVLYSFSAKVEDDCQLTSVDEIATAVHQMLGRIHEEAGLN